MKNNPQIMSLVNRESGIDVQITLNVSYLCMQCGLQQNPHTDVLIIVGYVSPLNQFCATALQS
jgi:hypothetical protein